MALGTSSFVPLSTLEGPRAGRRRPPAFHVMLKPTGAICNIDCSYCFYLRKEALYEGGAERGVRFQMSDEVMEEFTRQYIQGQRVPEVTFGWQGGEPTLMGIEFFRKVVAAQGRYAPPGMRVLNAFQTNGVLLDDAWCAFFREHGFLVGLSLDGPGELHDAHRVDKGGNGTFERVYRALKLLQKHGVEYNILCVVNSVNCRRPREVYGFYREEGAQFVQFIPAVERAPDGVTPWSVPAEGWGSFLCGVFDEWVRRDVGRVSVQQFEVALQAWCGMEPALCVHAETCGNCLALEHNGDLFSCDHFVDPEHFLGNIRELPLAEMVASPFERQFGLDKREGLPRQCRECDVRFACNGGCPKDRFTQTKDGEPGLNYLCAGYERFLRHVGPAMRQMAELRRRGYPPAAIMDLLPEAVPAARRAGRNEPCPCGSGRKFKQCCGRGR